MKSTIKKARPLRSQLGPNRQRVVELPANFGAVVSAIQQELMEWAAIDGHTSSQDALSSFLERQWKKAADRLGIEDAEIRDDAVRELVRTHVYYRCLISTIDRAPIFEKIHSVLLSTQRQLAAIERLLDEREVELSGEDAVAKYSANYIRDFMTQLEVSASSLTAGNAILSRQFELKARQFVGLSLRRLDRLFSELPAMRGSRRRGQPNKYSKHFLILRCARIFETFDTAKRKATVSQVNEAKRLRHGRLAPAYPDGFVPFVSEVMKAIDPKASGSPTHGLAKIIRKTLQIRKAYPDADEFVTNSTTPDDLLRFMDICEGHRM